MNADFFAASVVLSICVLNTAFRPESSTREGRATTSLWWSPRWCGLSSWHAGARGLKRDCRMGRPIMQGPCAGSRSPATGQGDFHLFRSSRGRGAVCYQGIDGCCCDGFTVE